MPEDIIVAPDGGEVVDRDIRTDEKQAYRVVTRWTDEETAHELLEIIANETGIRRDALSIEEGRVPVDDISGVSGDAA